MGRKMADVTGTKKTTGRIISHFCFGEQFGGSIKNRAEALFTISKLWKQPRCPTTDEWIKKMWYLYTTEFYAAMKKNEMLSFAGKWMALENIILSEVSLAQKTKNRMFSLTCGH
jgi:hypothetical protein